MEEGNTIQSRGRQRRVIIILAACALVGIGVVVFWPGQREPEYNGKTLSCWLDYSSNQEWDESNSHTFKQIAAVRSIGTNALDCLTKWVTYRPPLWVNTCARTFDKLPVRFQNERITLWFYDHGYHRRDLAKRGCVILGAEGAVAVPKLLEALKTTTSSQEKTDLLFCLRAIGPAARPALPYLKELAAGTNQSLASQANDVISEISPRGRPGP